MRSVLEWAQVRTLAGEGLSEREIARRLGINRRTVIRLARSDEPPRYRRAALGSQLDLLEPILRQLVEEWPQIKAPRVTEILRGEHDFGGSERLVREHLRRLRPSSARPAQRTGYREGAGNSVRRVGAHVGRIVGWPSHASTGCFDTSSDWRCCGDR